MALHDLLTTMMLVAVIAVLGRFFFMAKPLSDHQRHSLAHASQRVPLAEVLLQKGRATRHEYRQVLIAIARTCRDH
jgi:hypothetical protein